VELYLLRHTPVENPKNLCYGQWDMPLKVGYEDQLKDLKNHFSTLQGFITYTSESGRTKELAWALGIKDTYQDHRLNELNFGHWEGKPWNEIPEKELQKWMINYYYHPVPGGESYKELENRVIAFLKELVEKNRDTMDPVLLISHAGPIRCILSYFLTINPYKIMNWKIPEGQFWRVNLNENLKACIYPISLFQPWFNSPNGKKSRFKPS